MARINQLRSLLFMAPYAQEEMASHLPHPPPNARRESWCRKLDEQMSGTSFEVRVQRDVTQSFGNVSSARTNGTALSSFYLFIFESVSHRVKAGKNSQNNNKRRRSCSPLWRGPGGKRSLRAGSALSTPRHHAFGKHVCAPKLGRSRAEQRPC